MLANVDNLLGGGDNVLLPQPIVPQVAGGGAQQNGHQPAIGAGGNQNAGLPDLDQNMDGGPPNGGPAVNGAAPGDGGAPVIPVKIVFYLELGLGNSWENFIQ